MAKSKILIKSEIYNFFFKSRNTNLQISKSGFFSSITSLVITKLSLIFVKTLIIYYYDPEFHIQTELDTFSYIISTVFY